MATINQEKMGFPIFRRMLFPLSGSPPNRVICTGNAIIAAMEETEPLQPRVVCFFLPQFPQVIGEASCK